MALTQAILVTLMDRPHSGYEISKRFDQTVGFFWRARKQQIYQELHKLAEDGLIKAETIEQIERPNRIVYSITDEGRRNVDAWVKEPTPYPSVKEELLVKLFSLGDTDSAALIEQVTQRLNEHYDRLTYFRQLVQKHYPEPDFLKGKKLGHYLGLRFGVLHEEMGIAWCKEALELLGHVPPVSSKPKDKTPKQAVPETKGKEPRAAATKAAKKSTDTRKRK